MDALKSQIRRLEEDNTALRAEGNTYRSERDKFCQLLKVAEAEVVNRTIELLDSREQCKRLKKALADDRLLNVSNAEAGRSDAIAAPSLITVTNPNVSSPTTLLVAKDADVPLISTKLSPLKRKFGTENSIRKTEKVNEPIIDAGTTLEHREPLMSCPVDHMATPCNDMLMDDNSSLPAPTSSPGPSRLSLPDPSGPQPSLTPPKKHSKTLAIKKLEEGSVKLERGWSISQSKVDKYLASSKSFLINPPPLRLLVSRRALTAKYKLPGMGLLWTSKDGRYNFLTPTFDVNPEMPREPGAPGLLLSCRKEMCKDDPWTLFIKDDSSNKVRLNYAGEYVCKLVGDMTTDEFAAQDSGVKITWGDKIRNTKRHQVYREIHARIKLRKTLGSEPTENQVQAESELIKQKSYHIDVTTSDVIEAFERGNEHISIVKVECVGYNHDDAPEYARAQHDWEAQEKAISVAKANGTYQVAAKGNKKRKIDRPTSEELE